MSSETRREKIITGLMLCYALSREEAENMLRQYNVDMARYMQVEINETPEPKVWAGPLKWWRRGRDAALRVVTEDILAAIQADKEFDEKGHRL